jgi:FAD/FMN-containing dehydrogenase
MGALEIQELRTAFHGQVFEAADAGYADARKIWNASVVKRPRLIARCSGLADVIEAIHFGRKSQMVTAIRGGGHNVGGRALCDDGLVIDLSAMRGVYVDPGKRTVRVQGGATLGLMDRETHLFGLAVPSGIVAKTGIGGLTLGGGVGWLIRKYGMSIDNLLSCQIVTAEGRVLTASASEHPDLFWALRGGGGNFGVVTSFQFQGQPVHTVLGGFDCLSEGDGGGCDSSLPRLYGNGARRIDRLCWVAARAGREPYCGRDSLLLRRRERRRARS